MEGKNRVFFTLLWIVFIAFLFVCINVVATQYIASSFSYHKSLGEPILGEYYNPFSWFFWANDFTPLDNNTYGAFFQKMNFYVSLSFLGLFLIGFLGKYFFSRKPMSHDDAHGSARWSEREDIEKMGVLGNDEGVYIGAWKEPKKDYTHYLRHNGPEHILAFAPTRSGKGVGLVLPTLLSWKESCVVLDIKGENWALTAGWRQKEGGNKVLKFDPTAPDGESVKFNPLEEIVVGGEQEVGDVQNLAMMIVDPEGKGLKDYWAKAGFSILVAFILHALYKAKKEKTSPTLSTIYETINNPELEIREVLDEMMTYPHLKNGTSHKVVAGAAREAQNKADSELSGVIGTMSSNLGLYADPLIANNLAYSEFKISELMNDDKPVSLYLVIKPNSMDRLRPLVRIIMNQILRTLVDDMKFEEGSSVKGYEHRLLLMLDEFTALGKLEIFQQSLAYMAGYGIKSYIIIQDLTQLYNAYTKEEAIMSNCHIKIAYAPNKVETAELLSKMAGTKTYVKKVRSVSGNRSSMVLKNVSESYQETQRPLLTADECMTLPGMQKDAQGNISQAGDMLIFMAGFSAIYGKQILYFKDDEFLRRAKFESPKSSDMLISSKELEVKKEAHNTSNNSNNKGNSTERFKQVAMSNEKRF